MRLENSQDEFLDLRILGYEFPKINNDKWDSNWLKIEITVGNQKGAWKSSNPCLLTFEIKKLVKWFEDIKINVEGVKSELSFIEPNLEFAISIIENAPVVHVDLRYFLWVPSKNTKGAMGELRIELPLDEIDLLFAIRSLRLQLAKYPERAGSKN